MAQMDYETDGIVEKIGSALGADERRVKADLESFKVMVEEHDRLSRGWRGEVGAASSPPSDGGTPSDPLATPLGPLSPPDEGMSA